MTVRIFVGAFTGPTTLFGALGFFCINFVEFARPLYVPSPASPDTAAFGLVEPSRFFEDKASVAFSSYQLLAFVASLEDLIVVFLSASYFVADRSGLAPLTLFLEDAVTTPVFFFLRFILRPDSSSEEE